MLTIIYKFIEHSEANNSLFSKQYGYRKKRSTELPAVKFFVDIHRAMDTSKLTKAVFIDLSKAFDNIIHWSILPKPQQYGTVGNTKSWFTNYHDTD